MNERIKQFMDYKGLSSSEFADFIGVQRSNMSHILHGRNNPGFQFITKMLEKFPDINAKWLLTGSGEMIAEEGKTAEKVQPDLFTLTNPEFRQVPEPEKPQSAGRKTTDSVQPLPGILEPAKPAESKKIESVLIFYTDQTFKQYLPSK